MSALKTFLVAYLITVVIFLTGLAGYEFEWWRSIRRWWWVNKCADAYLDLTQNKITDEFAHELAGLAADHEEHENRNMDEWQSPHDAALCELENWEGDEP